MQDSGITISVNHIEHGPGFQFGHHLADVT